MNLILLDPREVDPSGQVTLSDIRATHLLRVLGVSSGRTVRVGLIDGPRGSASAGASGNGSVQLTCTFESTLPPKPRVDVLLALPRPKVMRRLWAQLSALGVGRIVLTNAERVERDYFDAHVLQPGVYRPLLLEGLQQACDTRVPDVSIHRRFRVLIEDELDGLTAKGLRVVADPSAHASVSETTCAHIRRDPDARVLMAIGPEGGWNPFELDLLTAHGFTAVSMGPRPLRTDTAVVGLVAIVSEEVRK